MSFDSSYRLEGETLGSCACQLPADCFCWEQTSASSGCDSFVAYFIRTGKIQGIDVSALAFVQVMREAEDKSLIYIDAKSSELQQNLLLRAFQGELGGILASLSSIFPMPDLLRLAPIRMEIETNQRAILWVGNVLIRKNMPRKSFCYQSD
jgi:hypothetical protein